MDDRSENPSTEELRAIQARREEDERMLAGDAADEREEHTHERRAEKAAYLKEKLEEQSGADER